MAITRAEERRLLSGAEFEAVQASHHPELAGMAPEQVRDLARRLREQRNRLRDQARAQRRARAGRADPRSGHAAEETGLSRRKAAIAAALRRVNGRIERAAAEARAGRDAARLRQALDRRRDAPVHHPDPGRTAGDGMRPLGNEGRMTGVSPGTVGSVSAANRAFQGRADAG